MNQDTYGQAEDLWRKLNPHPEGSYAWYGWSLEFTIDNGQPSPATEEVRKTE